MNNMFRTKIDSQFSRFLITGSINTLAGFSIIFLLMFFGVSPQISNISGYTVGLMISFLLNRNWVFSAYDTPIKRQIINFLLIFMVAFGINFLVLNILLIASINAWFSQIIAGVFYTVIFYVLNKRVVFT